MLLFEAFMTQDNLTVCEVHLLNEQHTSSFSYAHKKTRNKIMHKINLEVRHLM